MTLASNSVTPSPGFTGYQKFVLACLVFLQFTIILDFMILAPLGAILMPSLGMNPQQFGLVVSAYAFSSGASGLLAAGFADRFDRKRLLVFFYFGFLLGTLLCGLATSYEFLLIARIVTGLFGGVIGSIVFAITTDLFSFEVRGKVMGLLQTAFAASQVLGIPIGLFLANKLHWHAPFFAIVIVGLIAGVFILLYLKPIDEHLKFPSERKALQHLWHALTQKHYRQGFAATALLATGGFMLMPFGADYNVNNLKVPIDQLPLVYVVTGIGSLVFGPLIGKMSDRYGKYQTFLVGCLVTIAAVLVYTRLPPVPLWLVILVSVIMFAGVSARMISSSALSSALPAPQDRGAYMAIGSSIQSISGGIAAALAGMIVVRTDSGALEHFSTIGDVIVASTIATMFLMTVIHRYLKEKGKPLQASPDINH